MIRFYDASGDGWREATQEDWDLLYSRVVDKHKKLHQLYSILIINNIPIPDGHERDPLE